MKATQLYARLADDFINPGITDLDWAARMSNLDGYLHEGFKRSGMGLMCDFTAEIERVYTTVFLSDRVLETVLAGDAEHAMIFSHHPTNWSIEHHGGNYAATERYIAALQERNISVYVLHHPLDNYGAYSTCKTLADRLGMEIERPGFLYCGALCGVVGCVDCESISALHTRFSNAMGHETSLYQYGAQAIAGARIAICPGGGNAPFVIQAMLEHDIKILITGVTLVNEYSAQAHALDRENHINLLGGTHYSTEKFAPMEMCRYFNELGLPAEFIEDEPDPFDL